MSHRELGAAGEMGLPRLASSQALHGGAGSRRTWLGSLAQGCEVTPGLVPSLSSSLLGEMSRPVSAQYWLWEPPSAEGWGSDLCQPVLSGLSSYLLPLGSASTVLAAGRTGELGSV